MSDIDDDDVSLLCFNCGNPMVLKDRGLWKCLKCGDVFDRDYHASGEIPFVMDELAAIGDEEEVDLYPCVRRREVEPSEE